MLSQRDISGEINYPVNPRLPKDWPLLEITQIHLHQLILDITADETSITVKTKGQSEQPFFIYVPQGQWRVSYTEPNGNLSEEKIFVVENPDDGIPIRLQEGRMLRLSQ